MNEDKWTKLWSDPYERTFNYFSLPAFSPPERCLLAILLAFTPRGDRRFGSKAPAYHQYYLRADTLDPPRVFHKGDRN